MAGALALAFVIFAMHADMTDRYISAWELTAFMSVQSPTPISNTARRG